MCRVRIFITSSTVTARPIIKVIVRTTSAIGANLWSKTHKNSPKIFYRQIIICVFGWFVVGSGRNRRRGRVGRNPDVRVESWLGRSSSLLDSRTNPQSSYSERVPTGPHGYSDRDRPHAMTAGSTFETTLPRALPDGLLGRAVVADESADSGCSTRRFDFSIPGQKLNDRNPAVDSRLRETAVRSRRCR